MTTPEKQTFIVGIFHDAYHKKYRDFKSLIEPIVVKPGKKLSKAQAQELLEKIDDKCKSAALLTEIFKLLNDTEKRFTLTDMFEPFQLFPVRKPKANNVNSFINRVNEISNKFKNDVFEYLKDKRRGKTIGTWKVTDQQKEWAYYYYSLPNKLKFTQILKLVNEQSAEKGLPIISKSTLKNNILTRQIKEILYQKRYGSSDWRYNRQKPINRIPALYALDRIEFDATGFSIPVREGGKTYMLTLCIVVDCHSRFILGWSFDKTENHSMVIRAIKNALMNMDGYLPYEIFCDRFPGHSHDNTKVFFEALRKIGTHVTIEKTGNKRAKGLVENKINILGDFGKYLNDYVGKNITTTSKESRVSDERLYKIKNNYLSEREVVEMLREIIHLYNISKSAVDGLSPTERFGKSEKKNAIKITADESIKVFYEYSQMQVDRGIITLRRGLNKYHYEISDPITQVTLHGEKVGVRSLERELARSDNQIYVYDLHSDLFLFSCRKQSMPHLALANQTEHDKNSYWKHVHQAKEQKRIINDNIESMGINDMKKECDLNLLNHLSNSKEQLKRLKWHGMISGNPDSANFGYSPEKETDKVVVENLSDDDEWDKQLPLDDSDLKRSARLDGYDKNPPLEEDSLGVGCERLE